MSEPAVSLDVMLTGEVPTPHAYVYRPSGGNPVTRVASLLLPGGGSVRCACLAFAVRHPTAGTILVDTGFHRDAAESLRKDFGARMGLLFRSLRPAREPYDEQLRAVGADPEAVKLVVMTHLHVDHTSGMRLLPRAEFVCSREEWRAATAAWAGGRGFVSHHLPPEARMRLIDPDSDGVPHGPFARTVDLLGDGSIRLVSTPGHTPGHLSVLLRTPGGRPVLLIGDVAYTLRNVHEELLPLLTSGDRDSLRSLREIKDFAEREPDAILVPSHDPRAWHALLD